MSARRSRPSGEVRPAGWELGHLDRSARLWAWWLARKQGCHWCKCLGGAIRGFSGSVWEQDATGLGLDLAAVVKCVQEAPRAWWVGFEGIDRASQWGR